MPIWYHIGIYNVWLLMIAAAFNAAENESRVQPIFLWHIFVLEEIGGEW